MRYVYYPHSEKITVFVCLFYDFLGITNIILTVLDKAFYMTITAIEQNNIDYETS